MKKSLFMFSVITMIMLVLLSVGSIMAAPLFDFEGETVKLGFRFHDVTPFAPRGEVSWLDPDARLQAHIDAVEEMFNVKIEFVPATGDTNPEPHITAGITGDIIYHYHEAGARRTEHVLFPLAMQGFIHRLDDYLDDEYYESLPSTFRHKYGMQVGGHTYGVEALNLLVEPMVIIWNKDLFDEEGLPNPYDLYKEGKWDWDAFKDIAIQATKDTTGDGEINQLGIKFNLRPLGFHALSLFATNNASVTREVDGRTVAVFDEPEAVEVLEYLQELWNLDVARIDAGYANPRGGYTDYAMHVVFANSVSIPHSLMGVDRTDIAYSMVPLPRGPRATEHVAPLWNRWMGIIPIGVENPRAVIEVVNALRQLTEPYMDKTLEEFEEDFWDSWVMYLYDREALEVFQRYAMNAITVDNREIALQQGLGEVLDRIIEQDANITGELAAIKPVIQSFLDEVVNK